MAAPEMISRLMVARNAAHMAHLQTTSFAAHKALDSFYSDIVGLLDSFAETYQGIFGLITKYPEVTSPTGAPDKWIESLRNWLKKDRTASCKGETPLENIHDELQALCASTVYKLRYLDNPAMHEADEADEEEKELMGMSKW